MIDIEALRLEIAKHRGILLPSNDALFSLVIANSIVLGDLLEQINATQTELRLQSGIMVATEVAAVKSSAERLILGAVTVFEQAVDREVAKIKDTLSDATAKRLFDMQSAQSVQAGASTTFYVVSAALMVLAFCLGLFMR